MSLVRKTRMKSDLLFPYHWTMCFYIYIIIQYCCRIKFNYKQCSINSISTQHHAVFSDESANKTKFMQFVKLKKKLILFPFLFCVNSRGDKHSSHVTKKKMFIHRWEKCEKLIHRLLLNGSNYNCSAQHSAIVRVESCCDDVAVDLLRKFARWASINQVQRELFSSSSSFLISLSSNSLVTDQDFSCLNKH